MSSGGPFPPREPEFNDYVNAAVPYLIANKVRLLISAANVTAITNALNNWNTVYPPTANLNTRTQTAVDIKNTAKDAFLNLLRAVYAEFPASVLIAADRNTLNIHERDAPSPAPIPTTRPVCKVDTSMRLRHSISFTDESTPSSRAKPARVKGCEIWVKIGGESPADPSELSYLGTDTNSPFLTDFEGADAGKPAYYMIRWVNSIGVTGPWSETVMATITG